MREAGITQPTHVFDYELKTTFWTDFVIAERVSGEAGIRDTYKRATKEWRNGDITTYTELVMVLNWRIWALAETNEPLARVYDELWRKEHDWALDNLKGDDLSYYLKTTD